MSLNSVGFAGNENEVDLVWFRKYLQKLNDEELLKDIRAGQFLCRPNQYGKPREVFRVQLHEAKAEFYRRLRKTMCWPYCWF
jgi:hypothetical protein